MAVVKDIVKGVARVALKVPARQKIAALSQENEAARVLAEALRAAVDSDLTAEEAEWTRKVEAMRKRLSCSTDEVSIQDYGAEQPDQQHTDEEMYQGLVVKRTVGDMCRRASKPYLWSLVLFKLIRAFKPSCGVELGTCLGVSGSYQASAMKLNGQGRLITMEGAPSLAARAKENFAGFELDNVQVVEGRFQDNLEQVLEANKPIDYAFIDGHHDEKATLAYFEQMLPYFAPRAVVVFDDISWSEGMRRAWLALEKHEKVRVSVDMRQLGICILDDTISDKCCRRILLV